MSVRAEFTCKIGKKTKSLAEAVDWIPLLWIGLISSEDLQLDEVTTEITTDRKQGILRCEESIGFLQSLFPEFKQMVKVADDFHSFLRGVKAKTLTVEFLDHVAVKEAQNISFLELIQSAVAAIETRETNTTFQIPASTITFETLKKTIKTKARKIKSTRDILMHTCSFTPEKKDQDMARDQMIGLIIE